MEMDGPCSDCVFPVTDSTTPLMQAVRNGHEQCVNAWIEAGADVNSRDEDGSTALFMAVAENHLTIVKQTY